jgi:chromate transporter
MSRRRAVECSANANMTVVAPPRTLRELFLGFLSIGARSFGGVLPWAHRVMVEERRWLAPDDFTETIGLCQVLPGPNIGNASIVLGKRWFGLAGSVVAFLGLMALPFVWVLALAALYLDLSSNATIRAVVTGVGAAGAGLFIGTAIKLGRPLATKPAAVVLICAVFLAVGVGRVSLLIALPVAAGVAVLLARMNRI